jgi:hypothetical protein
MSITGLPTSNHESGPETALGEAPHECGTHTGNLVDLVCFQIIPLMKNSKPNFGFSRKRLALDSGVDFLGVARYLPYPSPDLPNKTVGVCPEFHSHH